MTFEIASDHLCAQILPCGASLVGVWHTGSARNLVLCFADLQDHARVPVFAGAIVGPVANRISGGRVTIGAKRWQMAQNDPAGHSLHSGDMGLHAQMWQVRQHTANSVTLDVTLADGACGLPGARHVTAEYRITDETLTLTLEATTDQPTPLNLAPHAYWNLDGKPDLGQHRLQIHASHYLPCDAENLPTGQIAAVENTAFDFQSARPVPLNPALDVNFCLSDGPRATPQAAAVLTGAAGTTLHIATTAPGVQVYNGSGLPRRPNALMGGRALAPYGAIALEPQYWPDAPRNAHFPNIMLHPGQRFQQITRYRISGKPT